MKGKNFNESVPEGKEVLEEFKVRGKSKRMREERDGEREGEKIERENVHLPEAALHCNAKDSFFCFRFLIL